MRSNYKASKIKYKSSMTMKIAENGKEGVQAA